MRVCACVEMYVSTMKTKTPEIYHTSILCRRRLILGSKVKGQGRGSTFRNFGTNCHPANKNKSDYCLFTKITFIMLNCDVSQKFRDIYVMKDVRRNYNLNF